MQPSGPASSPAMVTAFEGIECRVAALRLLGYEIGEPFRRPGVAKPEAHDRDVRLVAVLLEEHPLQRLRALVRIAGQVLRAVREVPEDRVRLTQRATVVENERGHAERRVEVAQELLPPRAIDDAHVDRLVLDTKMGQQEPHLVAVA